VNFLLSDGAAAGQEVDHAHLHVIPRYPGDGIAFSVAAWDRPSPSRRELDRIAEMLRDDAPG
jgi:histidine triad (HIT) family protein